MFAFIISYSSLLFHQNHESTSDTESSKGEVVKEQDFEVRIETDRSKRFDYLLKQTEIFSHFMAPTGPKSPAKPKAGRPTKKKDDDGSGE